MQPKSAEVYENRLQKLNAEYEEFAYIVSHDLKAPVRAITNLAAWLEEDLEGNLPGDSAENFRLLKNRLNRLDTMIQSLLDFSRVTRLDLDVYPFQAEKTINSLAEKLKQQSGFEIAIQGSLPEFETYGNKLTFVLQQLLENALKFNDKATPEITVQLADTGEMIEISVADNGPGIPEASLPKIFTMFYTAQSKDSLESTGAGLAIVNKIINFVDGRLVAENLEKGGAKFTLWWPKSVQIPA
jgi:signal transduction histidine kinase